MSTLIAPVRLILLDAAEWAPLLRARLAALKVSAVIITAPSWNAASSLLDSVADALVLGYAAGLPAPGECPLPLVLLLDQEPASEPVGVSDWLVKDSLSDDVLRRSLRYVREQGQLRHTLKHLAVQDSLTGLANRQGFHTLLAARISECAGHGLVLGHLDLDNFRHANDALGYQAGDRLIMQVVGRIKSLLQPCDHLARMGGDEFAVLLDVRRDLSRGELLAEQVTEALAEPYWLDGESLLIGCSLGMAHAGLEEGADTLLWQAQIAMQQAKLHAGCAVAWFDERLNRGARGEVDREAQLRRALRCNELELHYQPRLDLRSGAVVGIEALVRWRHPQSGLLAPDEFVPLAEESGLIIPLGYWVIARALSDMQTLRLQGLGPLHMAINLSFRQFLDSQLLPTLSRLIDEFGVDASWLEFELTETAVMRRSDQVRRTMLALSQLGVRFSLDDFGTGFSSFVHLNNLPITLLKIDKSFVGGMTSREENRQLVKAMINLGHNLELEVVAEGVETTEHMGLLRHYGCDQVQGYLISRALPLNELIGFLATQTPQLVLNEMI